MEEGDRALLEFALEDHHVWLLLLLLLAGGLSAYLRTKGKLKRNLTELIVDAEAQYAGVEGAGDRKLSWVIDRLWVLVPLPLQLFFPKVRLERLVEGMVAAFGQFTRVKGGLPPQVLSASAGEAARVSPRDEVAAPQREPQETVQGRDPSSTGAAGTAKEETRNAAKACIAHQPCRPREYVTEWALIRFIQRFPRRRSASVRKYSQTSSKTEYQILSTNVIHGREGNGYETGSPRGASTAMGIVYEGAPGKRLKATPYNSIPISN